jgi:hypothetical protein
MDDEVEHGTRPLSREDYAFATADSKFAMVRIRASGYRKGWSGAGRARRAERMSREDIMRRLELLRQEHRDLDGAIVALLDAGASDQMQIARFKKRKLRLRDEIAALEDALVPDIIA